MPVQQHRPHAAVLQQQLQQQQREAEEKTQTHSADVEQHPLLDCQPTEWSASLLIHKYDKVSLDVLAIQHERQRLIDDNARLKAQLEAFLNGIAITHNTMDRRDNTLLIVNPWSRQTTGEATLGSSSSTGAHIHTLQSTLVATVSGRQPLIQDGTLIVQQVAMQRGSNR